MNWIACSECEEEFRIITESLDKPTLCPFCGSDLEDDEDVLILREEWEE